MAVYGYGRVSRSKQETDLQLDAFKRAGVVDVVTEKWSSVGSRPRLQERLRALRPGDTLVVWKLDRVGRSLIDLLDILNQINAAGASFTSLTQSFDTSTPVGRLIYSILGAVAEFERSLIRERVVAGQEAARERGKTWGPKRVLSRPEALKVARMWRSGWAEQRLLADMFGMSESGLRDAIHWVENRGRWANRPSGH